MNGGPGRRAHARLWRGDAGAFETLYKRHRGALFRFVLRSIKQRAAAEELFQEIWIRVIEARSRYAPQARFTTWLYTIAHNLLVDHWRKKGLTLVELERGAARRRPGRPRAAGRGARGAGALRCGARGAAAAQREAFLLHQEAGLTVAEIAAATGPARKRRRAACAMPWPS